MTEAANAEKSNRERSTATKEMLSEAAEYIRENYWAPGLSLEQMAARFNISKFHLIKVFKEYTGMTPHSFLIAERINAANILLQTTDLTIAQISLMVGFRSQTNFIGKFKAIYKQTPQAYRESMQTQ
jgi:transcriptional regulator GlxA family with amidase domain